MYLLPGRGTWHCRYEDPEETPVPLQSGHYPGGDLLEDSWVPWVEARKLKAMDRYRQQHPELRIPAA